MIIGVAWQIMVDGTWNKMEVTLDAILLLFCWFTNHVLGRVSCCGWFLSRIVAMSQNARYRRPKILAKNYFTVWMQACAFAGHRAQFFSINLSPVPSARVDWSCSAEPFSLMECQLSKRSCIRHQGMVTRYSIQYLKSSNHEKFMLSMFSTPNLCLKPVSETPRIHSRCFCFSESLYALQETFRSQPFVMSQRAYLTDPSIPGLVTINPARFTLSPLWPTRIQLVFFFFLFQMMWKVKQSGSFSRKLQCFLPVVDRGDMYSFFSPIYECQIVVMSVISSWLNCRFYNNRCLSRSLSCCLFGLGFPFFLVGWYCLWIGLVRAGID